MKSRLLAFTFLFSCLFPGFAQGGIEELLTVSVPESCNGTLVVICPGGGYSNLAVEHEGAYVAEWLGQRGIAACVLRYRLPGGHPSVPLEDVKAAFRYCHAHAEEWNVHRIGIMGFSAGGHLAAMASNLFDDALTRPDFTVLFYPVVTLEEGITHKGTRKNLIGPDAGQVPVYSMENRVSLSTPPAFLVLTATDTVVPPENSIRYFNSLQRLGIPVEMHIFPEGPHGFGFVGGEGKDAIAPYRKELDASLERWLRDY